MSVDTIANLRGKVNAANELVVSASISSSGAAIEDGADGSIKATVKDYANSNPLAVVQVDTNGDPISGNAVTSVDGGIVTIGTTTDAAVVGDNNGTLKGAIRYLAKVFADIWDSTNHWLKISIQNATLAVTQSGAWSVVIAAGSAVIGHVIVDSSGLPTGAATLAEQQSQTAVQGATTGAAVITDANGTIQQYLRGLVKLAITAGGYLVNIAQWGGTTVLNGGTAGAPATGGIQAHDAADSGNNPTKIGAKAQSAEVAAVSSGDIANLITDLVGKLIVLPYANPENFVSGAITSAMTSTTSTSLLAAPASGLRNYITQITVSNGSTTVPTDLLIQDGSGGTTLYVIPVPIGTGTGTGTSGATLTFPTPLRQPTTATAIYCANVTTGSSVKVSASGYKGA